MVIAVGERGAKLRWGKMGHRIISMFKDNIINKTFHGGIYYNLIRRFYYEINVLVYLVECSLKFVNF